MKPKREKPAACTGCHTPFEQHGLLREVVLLQEGIRDPSFPEAFRAVLTAPRKYHARILCGCCSAPQSGTFRMLDASPPLCPRCLTPMERRQRAYATPSWTCPRPDCPG